MVGRAVSNRVPRSGVRQGVDKKRGALRWASSAAGKVAFLSGAGWLLASPAYAHPDPFTHAGALSWVLSALVGLAIVAAIWWSARR